MNEKNTVLQKLYELNKLHSNALPGLSSEKILEEMESILLNYLEKNPQDTEMWLKLTMIESTPPFEDYERIKKYIIKILEYDENNVQSLLVLAYSQLVYRGDVNDDLFIRLQRCCDIVTNKELLSMLYLAIAWYYYSWYSLRDKKKYELSLLKSIDYCNKHVHNYKLLGTLYLETGRKIEGKKMIQCALANVQKVYGKIDFSFDVTDINEFFNEFFRGIHITTGGLESLHKLLDR